MNEDAREFLRVAAAVDAVVVGAGGTTHGTTRDLSPKGAYVAVTTPFPEGSTCEVTLTIEQADPVSHADGITIRARGFVTRCDAGGMAIAFQEILGLDSWDHLRALVALNAEDADRARAQLADCVGLRRRPN